MVSEGVKTIIVSAIGEASMTAPVKEGVAVENGSHDALLNSQSHFVFYYYVLGLCRVKQILEKNLQLEVIIEDFSGLKMMKKM